MKRSVREIYSDVLREVRKAVVAQDEVFSLIFTALITGGHVLLEDSPGTGKTLLAKSFAKSFAGDFKRVQFTPDLLPQDITGLNIYDQKKGEFSLMKGPVFTNVLLADEINRATPRTQSSLLEAMEEHQVTIDGVTMPLEEPFLVIATQNPIETIGTYPLPEAELDRFLIKLSMGHLGETGELEILKRYANDDPSEEVGSVVTSDDMKAAKDEVRGVYVHECVMKYIVSIADALKGTPEVVYGISPRASLALLHLSQSFAAISGRGFVTPDDVRYLAPYVLSHRLELRSGLSDSEVTKELVKDVVKKVDVPVEDFGKK